MNQNSILTSPSPHPAVLWAVDPFEAEIRPDISTIVRLLKNTGSQPLAILPIYILSASSTQASTHKRLLDATHAMDRKIQGLSSPHLLAGKVLVNPDQSLQGEIERLLEFAEIEKSPFILVSSHGRSGLSRLTLGSFAEKLLQNSIKPVVFIPRSRQIQVSNQDVLQVFFPTDFSDRARQAYQTFLKQAPMRRMEITLFYVSALPASALGDFSVIPERFFEDQENWARASGSEWVHDANQYDIEASLQLEPGKINPNIGVLILEASSTFDLIVMSSLGAGLHSLIVGSVAREVFRKNSLPVWVYGPLATPIGSTGKT